MILETLYAKFWLLIQLHALLPATSETNLHRWLLFPQCMSICHALLPDKLCNAKVGSTLLQWHLQYCLYTTTVCITNKHVLIQIVLTQRCSCSQNAVINSQLPCPYIRLLLILSVLVQRILCNAAGCCSMMLTWCVEWTLTDQS